MENAEAEDAEMIIEMLPIPQLFDGVLVVDYNSFDDALAALQRNDLNDQFDNNLDNYGVAMRLQGRAHPLNETQAEMLLTKYGQNRSILLAFESVTNETCYIYWKAAGRSEFLFVELIKELDGQDSGIYEFVLNFVLNAIKNQHPGCKEEILDVIERKVERLAFVELSDHRDYNLLMAAVESNNITAINSLIELGFNLNDEIQGKTAADIAWESGRQDILLQLLKNNSVFPKNFDTSSLPDGELKIFTRVTEEFHQYLHARDLDNIAINLQENQHLRHFFNFSNKSAINVAIELKDLELYEFFITNNVSIGSNEDFEEIMKTLSDSELYRVRKIHDKHAIAIPERHVMTLLQNSKFSLDDQNIDGKTNYILQALLFLNQIPKVSLILMTVAAVKDFTITYDFKRISVHFIDPTSNKNDRGATYLSGMIYIGAKQFLENQLSAYATLGHELGHFAMDLVYDNLCKPYHKDDKVNRDKFEEICKKCEELKEEDEIIKHVYYYPSDRWHAELIVRIPHMIAEYQNDPARLEHLLGVFKLLNNYYNDKVLKDMETALPDIQNKAKVKFERAQRKAKMRKRLNICLEFLLVVSFCCIYLVYYHFKPEPIYSWHNLTVEDGALVRDSTINFQGYNVSFQELLAINPKALTRLSSHQIKTMIKYKFLNIGDKFQSNVEFYVERTFMRENLEAVEFNFEYLMKVLEEQKIVILSDKAGTGKTTAYRKLVEKLKDNFKLKWVWSFDLKKYFDAYEAKIKDNDKAWDKEKLISFIGKNLLRLNDSVEFAVFEERFNSDNVFLLWDGVDEISPHFKDFITDLFLNIQKFSNNSQWISTRPQYNNDLKENLNQNFSYHMKPYSKEDRVEFMRTFFTFNNLTSDLIEQKIQLFNEKIKNFDIGGRFIRSDLDSPLVIRMFGELLLDSSNSSLQFENKYLLYQDFVSKSFHIASEKGKIVTEDLQRIAQNKRINMYKIYEYFAFKTLLVRKKFDLQIEKLIIDLSIEEISRYGILQLYPNKEFEFIHRTFAEFFFAQYLIDNILQPAYTPRDKEINARIELLFYMAKHINIFELSVNFMDDYMKSNETTWKPSETFTKVAKERAISLTDDYIKGFCSETISRLKGFIKWLDLVAFVSDDEQFLKNIWWLHTDENLFIVLSKIKPKLSETVLSVARKHLPNEFTDEKVKKLSIEHAGNILFNYWKDAKFDVSSLYPRVVKLLPENVKNSKNLMEFLNETKEILTSSQAKLMIQTNIYSMLEKIETQDIHQFFHTVNDTLNQEEMIQSFIDDQHSCLGGRFRGEDEDYVHTLINEFKEFFDITVIENFLKNGPALQYSAMNRNAKVFKEVAKITLENLKTEHFDGIFRNKKLISDVIYRSSIATCESFASFLKQVYENNKSGLMKLLYDEDEYGETIFQVYNTHVHILRLEPFRTLAREFPFSIPPEVSSFDPSLTFNSNFYSVLERFVESKLKNSSELIQAHMFYAIKTVMNNPNIVVSLSENLTLSVLNGPGLLNLTSLMNSKFSHILYQDFFLAKVLIDRLYNTGNDTSETKIAKLFNVFSYIQRYQKDYSNVITLIQYFIESNTTQIKVFHSLIREKVKQETSELITDESCDHFLLKFFSKDEELLHLLLVESLIKKNRFDYLECIKPVYDTVNIQKILQDEEFRTKILERLEYVTYGGTDDLKLGDFKILFPDLIEAFESEL